MGMSPARRQRRSSAMTNPPVFAGLDVATRLTAICVVDETGEILSETVVPTEPEAIRATLSDYAGRLRRVGQEAGALSSWLDRELRRAGLPTVVLETRHAHAALAAQRNKTDRHDARGLAQILRTGWYKAVHVKSRESQHLRLLLTNRRTLKRKILDIENAVRMTLKGFGVKLGRLGRGSFADRVGAAVSGDPLLAGMTACMLQARAALWTEYQRLHRLLVQVAGRDPVCRRFMGVPGVGPVTAVTFKAGVDDPTRFARSKTVGAHFGLTPRRHQSGDSIDWDGRISRLGDGEVRTALYEAASSLLVRAKASSALKSWGLRIAKRAGHKKAVVAVARKLAVILHAMWVKDTEFRAKATKVA